MEKVDIPIGKKVKGYGFRNEYGEFFFIPAQIGTRTDGMKLVKQGPNYQILECKKKVKVVIDAQKEETQLAFLKNFLDVFNDVISVLRQYEW